MDVAPKAEPMVYTSSLVVMPPPEHWEPFVEIKRKHMNPRIKRPPYPHITLLAPFVPSSHFESTYETLLEALSDIQPFRVNFSSFEIFKNKSSSTLFLKPEVSPATALQDLYDRVARHYPPEKGAFKPHVGMGFFKNHAQARRLQREYQKRWTPIEFELKEIYIVSRVGDTTPFQVRKVIPLGGLDAASAPHFDEKPL